MEDGNLNWNYSRNNITGYQERYIVVSADVSLKSKQQTFINDKTKIEGRWHQFVGMRIKL